MADRVNRVVRGDINIGPDPDEPLVVMETLNRVGARIWDRWEFDPEQARAIGMQFIAAADAAMGERPQQGQSH